MKIIVIPFFIILFFAGCNLGECGYCDSLPIVKPTKKELNYIDTLKFRGFSNVQLFIPIIGEQAYGKNHYAIQVDCPFELTKKNSDSIILIRNSIANELYNSIIEDSIIYDCKELDIRFNYRKREIDPYSINGLADDISKDTLEHWNGFKVMKIGKDKYKRVQIK
jgi:hypothetical protein